MFGLRSGQTQFFMLRFWVSEHVLFLWRLAEKWSGSWGRSHMWNPHFFHPLSHSEKLPLSSSSFFILPLNILPANYHTLATPGDLFGAFIPVHIDFKHFIKGRRQKKNSLTASICENVDPFFSCIKRQNNPKYCNLSKKFHISLTASREGKGGQPKWSAWPLFPIFFDAFPKEKCKKMGKN